MFIATALLYPCVLVVLCVGAGLLVDQFGGRWLAPPLLLTVGAAALIAVSQLTTYVYVIAPATPYVIAALALAGFVLGRERAARAMRGLRARPWLVALPLLVYVLALAPVLLSGRPSFSSYMALADSAVHMIGADFLIRHGQHYAHLDLRNSYGQFINDYYNGSYPSGADTLLGGSAFLLGLPHDLGLPAVQRVRARDRRRARMAARAQAAPQRRLGGAGGDHGGAAGARLRV